MKAAGSGWSKKVRIAGQFARTPWQDVTLCVACQENSFHQTRNCARNNSVPALILMAHGREMGLAISAGTKDMDGANLNAG
jgi:hypothetical protein